MRRGLAAAFAAAGLILAVVLGGYLLLHFPAAATPLANGILSRLPSVPGADQRVESFRVAGLLGIDVRNFRLARGDSLLVAVDHLRAVLKPGSVWGRGLGFKLVEAEGVFVSTAGFATEDSTGGSASLESYLAGDFYSGVPLQVDRIRIRDSKLNIGETDPPSILKVALNGADVSLGDGFACRLDSVNLSFAPQADTARGIEAAAAIRLFDGRAEITRLAVRGPKSRISGEIRLAGSEQGHSAVLDFSPLVLDELSWFLPDFDLHGQARGRLNAEGPDFPHLGGRLDADLDAVAFGDMDLGSGRLHAEAAEGRVDLNSQLNSGGALVELSGWVRPFDSVPTYVAEVHADRLPQPVAGRIGTKAALPARLELRIDGQGFDPMDAAVRGSVERDGQRAQLTGRFQTGPVLTWELEEGRFEQFDPVFWTGDTSSARLTGTVQGRGRGVRLDSISGELAWQLQRLDIDPVNSYTTEGTAVLEGSRLGARLSLADDRGTSLRVDSLTAVLEDLQIPVLHGRFVLSESAWRGRRLAGVGSFGYDGSALSLDAALETGGGHIAVQGTGRRLDSDPEIEISRAQFRQIDLSVWSRELKATRLSGDVQGTVAVGRAKPGDSIPVSGYLDLRLSPSTFAGMKVPEGGMKVFLEEERFKAAGEAWVDSAQVQFKTEGVIQGRAVNGRIELEAPLKILRGFAPLDSLQISGVTSLDAAFSGSSFKDAYLKGTLTAQGAINEVTIDSLLAAVELQDGLASIDTLALRSNAGHLDASGTVAFAESRQGDLQLAAVVTDAAPFRAWVGADTLSVEKAELDLRLTGSPASAEWQVGGNVLSLAKDTIRLRNLVFTGEGRLGKNWSPVQARAAVKLNHGYTPSIRFSSAEADMEYTPDFLSFDLSAESDPQHRIRLQGSANRDSTGIEAEVRQLNLVSSETSWSLAHPVTLRRQGGRLTVDPFELHDSAGSLRGGGVLDTRGEQDFEITMQSVGLDVVDRWLGRSELNGSLDAEFAVTGPAERPHARGEARLTAEGEAGVVGTFNTRLDWIDSEARIDVSFASPGEDSLIVSAILPARLTLAPGDSLSQQAPPDGPGQSVQFNILARNFPLSALVPLLPPASVSSLGGTLNADLRLSGREHALSGSGGMEITEGFVTLENLGVKYRDLKFVGELEGNRLLVKSASVRSGRGEAGASGEITVKRLNEVLPSIRLTAREFLFTDTPGMRIRASADLTVGGHVLAPEVRGSVSIRGSRYTLTDALMDQVGGSAEVQLTEDDIRMLEEAFGYQHAVESPWLNALYEAAALDVRLQLEQDNWIHKRGSPRLDVEVVGELQAQKPPAGQITLKGRLAPVPGRGYIEEFGRSFDFAGGELLFDGPPEDVLIDIQSEYKVRNLGGGEPEVVVRADLSGRPDDIQLNLTSDPPLSRSEILSYISTGQSPGGASQSSGQAMALAAQVGLSQVTGGLQDAVQGKVGLDVLQVRYDAQQGATVVAGRYLAPALYVGLRQPVQYQETSATTNQNPYQTLVEVEYEVYTWLLVNLQGASSRLRSFIAASHEY